MENAEMTEEEIAILKAYRSLDDGVKKALLNMMLYLQEEEKKRNTQ